VVTYGYVGGSSLIAAISLPNSCSITNTYDTLGRLSVSQLRDSYLNVLDYQGDTRDNANRLTRRTRLNSYVDYGYDAADQLASANGYESGSGAQRRHEWLSYGYDAAGNLTQRNNNALVESFGINNLNEVTSATTSGTVTVSGMTYGASSVSVNGSSAAPFADGSFAVTGVALASSYTATAQNAAGQQVSDTVTGLSSGAVNFNYDANGNLTGDGKRSFTYDDENRLTRVEVAGLWRTDFAYDGLGRRRWRREYDGNGALLQEVRHVFDGNLVIQERDGNNNVLVSYARGLDLSGTCCEAAGGIGGLLARTDSTGTSYYHSDSGGNVTALTDASERVVAKYLYDPFGNIIAQSGALADANVYRFSSKEYHANSGLCYFGGRFYDPNLQRWLNRDPLGIGGVGAPVTSGNFTADSSTTGGCCGESLNPDKWISLQSAAKWPGGEHRPIGQGVNLYRFVENDPLDLIDPDGQNLFKELFRFSPIKIPIPGPLGWAYLAGWAGAILIDKGTDLLYPDPGPTALPLPTPFDPTIPDHRDDLRDCYQQANNFDKFLIKKGKQPMTDQEFKDYVNACMKGKGYSKFPPPAQ
jgi:RHS repeat-associated protein